MSNKLNALFSAVKMLFETMKQLNTAQGALYYEGELEVGVAVYTDEGPAVDGAYESESKIYVVKNGIIAEIKDAPVVEEPAAEPDVKNEGESAEELGCGGKKDLAEEPVAETVEPAPAAPEFDPSPIYTALEEINARITALEAQIADIAGAPEGTTPSQEFSKVSPLAEFGTGISAIKALKASMKVK